ncbi:MAG: glutamate racemase, partial [Chloroflexi bacterium]|nr:glutamate racemase [Chloroflexota bacterium]
DLVEGGAVAGPAVEALLRRELAALPDGVDAVALGCTHYGFVRATIEQLLGPGVRVVDAAEAVARRVQQQLVEHGLAVPGGAEVTVDCAATGDAAAFAATVERLRAAGSALPPLRVLRPEAAVEERA